MRWIIKANEEFVAEVITNHSITDDQAIELAGFEKLEKENFDDPDYKYNGKELWFDDLTVEPVIMDITVEPGNYSNGYNDRRFNFGCDWSIVDENGASIFLFDPNYSTIINQSYYIDKVNEIIAEENEDKSHELMVALEAELSTDEDVCEALNAAESDE